jgi:hypothetical protein
MSVTAISLFLTRSAQHADDDAVIITPSGDDFKIQYKNPTDSLHHFFYASENETNEYLRDLFTSLSTDGDPYAHVQVNIPCFPSVFYSCSALAERRISDTVLFRISEVLKNWPEKIRYGSQ